MIKGLKNLVLVMLVSYVGLWILSGITELFLAHKELIIVGAILVVYLLIKIAKEEL